MCALIGEFGVGELHVPLETIFLDLFEPMTCFCHVIKPRAGGAAIIEVHLLIRFVVVENQIPSDLHFEAGLCGGLRKLHGLCGDGVFQQWGWPTLWGEEELAVFEGFGDNVHSGARVGMVGV